MINKHGSREAVTEHQRTVGAKGGSAKVPKGFALNPKLASRAGRRGGRISKRKKVVSNV
jgi:general stress protein YciG